ncbi:MAG: PBP1A family penicillin-binding protein [Alphaproteobacteria bacterium]|nr:PBP1A family penicillin-binding protein [Alphaproteobacteria bacterium]
MKKFFIRFFKGMFALVVVIGVLGTAILGFDYMSSLIEDLPDYTSLKKYVPDVSTRVFLQDGRKLAEYSYEKRYFIPIDKVPQKVINAFVAAEDKHFFQHMGIDLQGIMRSIIKNLENLGTGRRPQGASTITQQVARIFLIKTNEVSYVRKLKEAILAYKIESSLSKRQILELYLNQVYMGLGAYGVAAAAKTYFNKTLDELTIAECAYLASLVKGANNYHPVKHKKKAITRRNWVINRQLEDGYISKAEATVAMQEDLVMNSEQTEDVKAGYFAEEMRKYLMDKFPSDNLNKEGLVVRATLDTKMQQCAYDALRKGLEEVDRRFGWRGPVCNIRIMTNRNQLVAQLKDIPAPKGGEEFQKAVVCSLSDGKISILTDHNEWGKLNNNDAQWIRKKIKQGDVILVEKNNRSEKKSATVPVFSLKQIPKVQGAIIAIEVETGRILAMQGGYSFSISEFNRATQAMRQCGSAFKPFVYLAGLENGFAPNTVIDASAVEVDLGESLGVWKPKNYHGMEIDKITMRRALERSINTATVRIAQETGLDKIAKIAEQFGIFEKMPQLLSYALGAGETTLLKLTTAYAMLANGGKRITPTMIDYVLDRNGNILYKNDNRLVDNSIGYDAPLPPKLNDNREQILDERSVYQITSLLEGVIQRGSGASARFLNFPMAGKTGTSNESRDTWFVGYTPDIAVGVFVGFDDHSKSLGKNANGTNTALPIFISFMSEAKKFLTPTPFRVPKGIKLRKIDIETGGTPTGVPGSSMIEAFKDEDDEIQEDIIETKKNEKNKKRGGLLELINDSIGSDDEGKQEDKKEPNGSNGSDNHKEKDDDETQQIVTSVKGVY